MRKPSACTACRARRRKCNVTLDRPTCSYCLERNVPCVWEPPPGGFYEAKARQNGTPRPSSVSTEWPSYPLQLHLVTLYFYYIHDQNHSIFHRPTFLDDLAQGRVPRSILCAIFALSARFSTDPSFAAIPPRQRGQVFFEQAEQLVRLSDVSLHTVQLCILLGGTASAEGNAEAENIFYGVAGRMAQLLDLPRRPATSALEREVHLRVWWTLCMVDVWSSTSVKLPKFMPLSADVALPMDELPFLAMGRDTWEAAAAAASELLPQMVKLNRILLEINAFNQRCVAQPLDQVLVVAETQSLELRLERWLQELPDNLHDTPENLAWCASQGFGRMHVALFLGFYHFGQLLYYQFLHSELHEPTAAVYRRYADRCKAHAGRLCDTIYRASATPGCDVRYAMVGHVLVIASTVQVHTLLTSPDEAAIRIARQRLEKNFTVLLSLRPYWPMLDRAMGRLHVFHETCRRSMDTSFVLDRWMLRFLEEPGKLMEEKHAGLDAEALWTLEAFSLD